MLADIWKHVRVWPCAGLIAPMAAIVLESGPKSAAFKHFRLRRGTVHLWMLDMAGHGQLQELVDMVMDAFPWTLADVTQNSERKHQS